MSPLLKYTLGRLGLFLAVFLVLYPVPELSLLLKLLIALVVSFALSWYLLRGWRDQASVQLASRVERRRGDKEKLRAALAGVEEPEPGRDHPDQKTGQDADQQPGPEPDQQPEQGPPR